jgi:hypothetical protein
LIKPAQRPCWPGDEAVGKPGERGVYEPAFQLLSHLGRHMEESQGFKPDLGNPAVRDYRGAEGNVAMVGIVNPSCNRKSRNGNPPPIAERALDLSQPKPPCRGRFQTAISCCGSMIAVVNVMVKRRDSDHVMCG